MILCRYIYFTQYHVLRLSLISCDLQFLTLLLAITNIYIFLLLYLLPLCGWTCTYTFETLLICRCWTLQVENLTQRINQLRFLSLNSNIFLFLIFLKLFFLRFAITTITQLTLLPTSMWQIRNYFSMFLSLSMLKINRIINNRTQWKT